MEDSYAVGDEQPLERGCARKQEAVLEMYGAGEGKRGVYKCRGDGPLWFVWKSDYKHVKGGDMREWKQTGDQCWCRLARPLGAFRQRRKSWVKKKR